MNNNEYTPRLSETYINPLKICFSSDELGFIQDNCFYNLNIDQINEQTITKIYDEIANLIEFYRTIEAFDLVRFATEIEDKLFDFIDWNKFENNEQQEPTITTSLPKIPF